MWYPAWAITMCLQKCRNSAIESLEKADLIEEGSLCVVTRGVPHGIPGTTNVMEVRMVGRVVIKGTGIGNKPAWGKVVVVSNGLEAVEKISPGCVLVAQSVDKSYTPVLSHIAGLIMEQGGLTSDGAIMALNFGFPAVVGVGDDVNKLRDGDIVTLDAARGVVYKGVVKIK